MSGHVRRRTLPSGEVRYYPVLDRHTLGGFARKKDAEARLKRAQVEKAAGRSDVSFAEFAARWLADYGAGLRPVTRDGYERVVRKHLLPHFDKTLADITPADVQAFVSAKVRDGYAPKTVSMMLTQLKGMFRWAIQMELTERNPAASVRAPHPVKKEMEFLSPDEIKRLLDAASDEARPVIAVAVFTGLRQGELLALRVSDLELDRGLIFVRRSYSAKYGYVQPKSAAGRRAVRIGPGVTEILRAQVEGKEGLVFGTEPLDKYALVHDEFHPALARAGVKRIRWHDLRHTYAALMISLGCNVKFLQSQLGHSSIKMTLDRYGHLLPSVDEGIEARMEALVMDENVVPIQTVRIERAAQERHTESSRETNDP